MSLVLYNLHESELATSCKPRITVWERLDMGMCDFTAVCVRITQPYLRMAITAAFLTDPLYTCVLLKMSTTPGATFWWMAQQNSACISHAPM